MYLLIDNYDSFTYNIFQYMCELTNEEVLVIRNDRISLDGIEDLNPRAIILSPGPGRPEDAGICVEAVRRFAGRVPILGICLGHQAIAYAFGGVISGANRIVHGKAEPLRLDGQGLFRAIPSPAVFTRYHSLVVIPESFPGCLEVTATSTDGEIMGLRHREFQVEGIQFHPESYASEYGRTVLKNFINYRREPFELKTVLTQIISGKHLSRSQSEDFMDELTEGNFTDVQTAAFLTALNAKGIDAGELAGCASVLKRKCLGLSVKGPLLDTCGTGGDDAGSFNISSLSALVAAA
ncbi:MAG: bifunctional anthranilate synthase component II/anthranilate phosphoribosyltransferase, partial [Spirochaetales bacterium]